MLHEKVSSEPKRRGDSVFRQERVSCRPPPVAISELATRFRRSIHTRFHNNFFDMPMRGRPPRDVFSFAAKNFARPASARNPQVGHSLNIRVVHRTAEYLVVNKPSHVDVSNRAFVDRLCNFSSDRCFVVEPPDTSASGLLLVGWTSAAKAELTAALADEMASQVYAVLCRGETPEAFTIDRPLCWSPAWSSPQGRGQRREHVEKAAVTDFVRIATCNEGRCSLLLALPRNNGQDLQERPRQIRMHLEGVRGGGALLHPVAGDDIHGAPNFNRVLQSRYGLKTKRVFLHSAALLFKYRGEAVRLVAPLPEDLRAPLMAMPGGMESIAALEAVLESVDARWTADMRRRCELAQVARTPLAPRNEAELYSVLVGHHRLLRDQSSASVSKEAAAYGAHHGALKRYAAAAAKLGERAWIREGIDWCVAVARDVLTSPRHAGGRADEGVHEHEPIRLLDVGSCGSLFDGYAGVQPTALDLCPQKGHGRVMQCDFLHLQVGGHMPAVEPSAEFAGGRLTSLPAGSFDVVAMSLVLSYLPLPAQRGAMVLKARQLLRSPLFADLTPPVGCPPLAEAASGSKPAPRRSGGLLLLIETLGVDRRGRSWEEQPYLRKWAAEIEKAGFVFLRHETLMRSHALAFATAPQPAVERPPPELRMRRDDLVVLQRRHGLAFGIGEDRPERYASFPLDEDGLYKV